MDGSHIHDLGSGPESSAGSDEGIDEVLTVLSDATRRFVVSYLDGRDEPVAPETLAEALAEWDDDYTPRDAHVALHHVHLPKLEAVGFVAYDDAVELTDDAVDPTALL